MKALVVNIVFLMISGVLNSQYYTSAGLIAADGSGACSEGDMYLDTTNKDYRIGLTNGKLGNLTDNQDIDSLVLVGDSLEVFIARGKSSKVDLSSLKGQGTVGDIKSGIQTVDHGGWYLLDGRAVASLPAFAQASAASLGIGANLPDATNRVMKAKAGAEALMSTGGNATHTITQANIPNYNLPATTTTNDGVHAHTATTDSAGKHRHKFDNLNIAIKLKAFSSSAANEDTTLIKGASGIEFITDTAGQHIHNVTVDPSASHNHSVTPNSGGSDTPFDLYQPYMVINRFIYLGQ